MVNIPLSKMDRTDRLLVSFMIVANIAFVFVSVWGMQHGKRINAMEGRLQNMEHLLSLSASESRSSASNGPTNGLPAFAPAPREGIDAPLQRRVKRKSGHYPPAHDRRTEGQ